MYTVAVNFYVGFSLSGAKPPPVKFISLVNGQTMAETSKLKLVVFLTQKGLLGDFKIHSFSSHVGIFDLCQEVIKSPSRK